MFIPFIPARQKKAGLNPRNRMEQDELIQPAPQCYDK
jgi:hypothetical protein